MDEKEKKNKREWVKTATIIFLSIMLVLTFFSNTIMNYSLPVVAAQYIQSGTITAKIRGTGTVEAGDPYNVELQETRVISSVAVKKGDTVEKDQVLFYLEDAESTELQEAEKALNDEILKYEIAILSGDISGQVVNNVQSGVTANVTDYQARILEAENKIKTAQAAVDSINAQITENTRQLSLLEYSSVDSSSESKAAANAAANLAAAQTELSTANATVETLQKQLDEVNTVIFNYDKGITVSGNGVTQEDIDAQYRSAKATVNALTNTTDGTLNAAKQVQSAAQSKVNAAQDAKNKADSALSSKTDTSGRERELKIQKENLTAQLAASTTTLENATEAKKQLVTDISTELSLGAQTDTIAQLRENVNKLREDASGTEVKAPVAGTVTTLNYVAGETTKADTPLAVLQPEGKGFSLSFSVTAEQAKRVNVGDPADIQNSWYYSDLTATLASIKNDPENPGKNKLLVFDIEGDVTNGQSLSLSVGQKSADYEMIVPNSAIREDSNGKFILIVESKSSPLGNRYVATRTDVEVLASDDTQSAISGALYGYEFVITTSTKPVEAGKLVRLADE